MLIRQWILCLQLCFDAVSTLVLHSEKAVETTVSVVVGLSAEYQPL